MGGVSIPLYFIRKLTVKMNNFDILKNNFLFRLLVGLNTIFIGLILLILYLQRNKENTWGQIYLSLYESLNQIAKLGKSEKMDKALHDKVWLLLAILGLFTGIVIIFFGFG